METEKRAPQKYLILSSFWIKIIALILMTLDHVALFFLSANEPSYQVLRSLGRLAFPLYAFLMVEGVFKSHNAFRYGGRLLILGAVTDLALFLIEYFGMHVSLAEAYPGNSLTELGLGVFMLAFFEMKGAFKLLGLIPLALMVLSDFPSFFPLRFEYGTYGALIFLGFYFSKYLTDYYEGIYASRANSSREAFYDVNGRLMRNLISAASLLIVDLLMLFFYMLYGQSFFLFVRFGVPFAMEQYSALAGVIIFFYNASQGYHAKWFRIANYLYYPLHMAVMGAVALF